MKVCRVSEIRDLDNRAQREYGISEEILMENAGEAVYFAILKELGVKNKKFAVYCGPGNNGGDGFVVARKIYSSGGEPEVSLLTERERYQRSAKTNLERIEKLPIKIKRLESADEVKETTAKVDAIVDGIFGTGIDKEVGGMYKEVIQLINESKKPVFSIDISSGVNGDTGQEMGISVKADYTITFGLPKIGNLIYPGYGRCGKLYVSHISYPQTLQQDDSIKTEVLKPTPLPERRADTTKFDYGPVLFIAGSKNYYWAPIASAYSCLKAGGGYSYLACPASVASSLAERGREVVFLPQKDETSEGSLALKSKESLLKDYKRTRPRMAVMGPGLSTNEETQQLVRELAREIEVPLLIDGDGITALFGRRGERKEEGTEIIKSRKYPPILTPHAGEMARIAGVEREYVEKNRVEILQKTAKELNSTIVLKAPHSLVGFPDQRVYISLSGDTEGKAGMATAGSGDVLNGTIAAMYCLGINIEEAVKAGVFIHGLAGDLAAQKKGPDGMVASDILDFLPEAVKHYRENFDKISENFYDKIYLI